MRSWRGPQKCSADVAPPLIRVSLFVHPARRTPVPGDPWTRPSLLTIAPVEGAVIAQPDISAVRAFPERALVLGNRVPYLQAGEATRGDTRHASRRVDLTDHAIAQSGRRVDVP